MDMKIRRIGIVRDSLQDAINALNDLALYDGLSELKEYERKIEAINYKIATVLSASV